MGVLLAFVALPLIEIALFVKIGGLIGLWPTLAFVIASFLLGVAVIRAQGDRSLDALRRATAGVADPTEPLAHGALRVLGGVLLIVPGFLTSALGLLLMIPALRGLILRRMARSVRVSGFGFSGKRGTAPDFEVIDGDFQEIPQDRLPRRDGPSGWTRG